MPKLVHAIAVTFEDGATVFVDCYEGESLVDAGDRAGVRIPTDCRDGVCGTCRTFCESGTYAMSDDYLEEALSEDEEAAGFILACQTRPLSDMVIHVPVASSAAGLSTQVIEGSIASVTLLSSSTAELIVETGVSPPMQFLPGQYAGVRAGDLVGARNYSFSNEPGSRFLEFLVRLLPGGGMSEYLVNSATIGDPVEVHGPMGSFYLREIVRPTLFVAGGTGLAPFLSMLQSKSEHSELPRVTLLLGVTKDEDLVKLDELMAFKDRHSWFDYQYRVACPADRAHAGLVTDLLGPELDLEDADLYICGPPKMVEAVHRYTQRDGRAPVRVFVEKFLVSSEPSAIRAE